MPSNATEPHNSTKLPIPDLPEVGHTVDYEDTPRSEGSRRHYAGNHHPAEGDGLVLRFKSLTRVFWAEFFGTAILALFGTAANNQVALSNSSAVSNAPAGTYISVAFGWALAVMLGVYVSGGVSGGHINPAITLAMAIFRGFPWKKVPIYWAAQLTGSVTGAALTYWNYRHAIDLFEGGGGARTIEKTGGLFFTNPLSSDNQNNQVLLSKLNCPLTNSCLNRLPYVSNFNCFYNEFLMTALLMIFVVAVGDEGNTAPPKNMGPIIIFWVVFGLASTLGMQTSFSLNPARDLGPRLVTWFAGYGSHVWSVRSHYWFVVAILGPVCGAIVGAFIYDFFIATNQVTCTLHGNNSFPPFLAKFLPAKRNRQEQLNGLESGQA
ncbi:hypothetical protein PGT21_007780 [Puccinia graminis f. sp. tritici]|uniref:Aquaporin n=2 Tax=Puccinia graminis f. sp. tritici TaxID=56615 RepID=E3KKD1_PUCGT|nr:uncharacterized protein PGTG_10915 [Puccinia graminis f. sp. tritici CRL 75-36-700-3]EFP84756.2 hypothetical protein PGTG_10915 [Puccinia graminis f. sp. tritici CRL 75-36-700-3]KAA1101124.1 hypothetical protein PGT21_007780 [Puccinia graminis f. sp. tritici]